MRFVDIKSSEPGSPSNLPTCCRHLPRSFRPVKSSYKDASQDQISKLRLFDFPLNSEFTGLIRAVEMPSGKQVGWIDGRSLFDLICSFDPLVRTACLASHSIAALRAI